MCRRQLLVTAHRIAAALQHGQPSGHLHLGPVSSCVPAALHAIAGAQRYPQLPQLTIVQKCSFHNCLHQQQLAGVCPTWQWKATTAAAFSTSPESRSEEDLRIVQAEISENEYHKLADEALDFLQEKLEVFVEDMDIDGGDVEHAQGVLTVKLGSHGTYVINKQTPNRQIWLSSPVTGPFRYDWHNGSWVYHRDGRELFSQLQQELQQLLGSGPHLVE